MTVFETEIEDEKDLLARICHVKWMAVQCKLLFPGIRILEKFKNSGGGEKGGGVGTIAKRIMTI